MRFQVQWNTKKGGPTFAEPVTAPSTTGVTVAQAIAGLDIAHGKVVPRKAKDAASDAVEKQKRFVRRAPAGGGIIGQFSKSEPFDYGGFKDARVDVENQSGHNLRS